MVRKRSYKNLNFSAISNWYSQQDFHISPSLFLSFIPTTLSLSLSHTHTHTHHLILSLSFSLSLSLGFSLIPCLYLVLHITWQVNLEDNDVVQKQKSSIDDFLSIFEYLVLKFKKCNFCLHPISSLSPHDLLFWEHIPSHILACRLAVFSLCWWTLAWGVLCWMMSSVCLDSVACSRFVWCHLIRKIN